MALGHAFYDCFGFKPVSVTPSMLPTPYCQHYLALTSISIKITYFKNFL